MMAIRHHSRPPPLDLSAVTLLIVFLAALAVRLYGIDWDDGADLHPDELFITNFVLSDRIGLDWSPNLDHLLDPARSSLNPRSADPATGQFREFAYGALPLWVTDATAWALSRLTGSDWNAADRVYLVGRAISAILGALTIVPIAMLGAAIGGRSVGLLSALFAALAPMSIQLAHFFTTDSWLTFFVALSLVASVRAAQSGRTASFAAAGAAFGLAMATKGSVFALAAPIVFAVIIDATRRFGLANARGALRSSGARSAAAAAAAALAFVIFEPYALLRPDVYLHSIRVQADIASGAFDVPFTRVYAGTVPFIYQLEQFVRWGYGPVAGLLAIAGIVMVALLAVRHRCTPALILLSWLGTYGGVILLSDVKFLRYLEPLAPVFAVGAALALAKLSTSRRPGWLGMPRQVIPLVAVALTVVWTSAFLSIYAHENPRHAASRWIFGAIPPGAVLTAEYWDDALPRSLAYAFSPAAFGYATSTLDLYRDLPPVEASDAIFDGISQADVIIQSSERVEAAVRAAPWRYPVQGRFFDQLEQGSLGFEQAAVFARPPSIGRVPIDDRGADESFINYDHPRVSVFSRTQPTTRADHDAAMSWALDRPWYPSREPPRPTLLLDGPVGENPSVNDAQWSAATSSTPAALAVWVVLLLVLLLVGLPIARTLLPAFPDRGWGLARTLALAIAAYPVWLLASLELIQFRAIWVAASMLGVGVIAWRLHRSRRASGVALRGVSSGRYWLHAELAFWLVFVLFLVFRLVTPDGWHPFWGGEKPMELALINAIQRSAYFPPYDPWFADGYVNYYYYGFYLMAFLLKATGMPTELGFNLALPTVMGLLASGGFSMAAVLARGVSRSPCLGLVGGWCGVIALSVLGNLSAARGLVEGGPAGLDPFLFWTWRGSRAIDNAITEFPYFSGLYADLHAHVIALPLTVAAIALSFAVASGGLLGRADGLPRLNSAGASRLIVLALLIGSLGTTNAWDVPVYAMLAITAIFMATSTLSSQTRRLLTFAVISAVFASAAWILFLPFHRHFVALFGHLALVRDPTDLLQFLTHLGGLLVIGALGLTSLLLNRGSRSQALSAWPWLTLAVGALGLISLSTGRDSLLRIGSLLIVGSLVAPPLVAAWLLPLDSRMVGTRRRGLTAALILAASVVAAASALSGRAVFGLLVAIGGAAAVGWLDLKRIPERFTCLLLAAGCFTAAGVEVIVVADDLIGTPAYRMNTVFKFYNQVWILLALAGSALVALMIREAARAFAATPSTPLELPGRRAWSRYGLAASALVLLASLAYPAMATGPRLAQRFTPGTRSGTLDALTWMESGTVPVLGNAEYSEIAYAGDAAAIDWFLANVSGTPVIAEAAIGPYRCHGSRISAATGLPTIIGWERHQQQQRYPETLPPRVDDVRTLYTSTDAAEKTSILRRYNVEYVVVGDLERLYPIANNECTPTGSEAGIAAFENMLGTTLEVVHSSSGTTIYRVLPIAAA